METKNKKQRTKNNIQIIKLLRDQRSSFQLTNITIN